MKKAGIRIWVLTGDKLETAETIGRSTGLLNQKMQPIYLTDSDTIETELINQLTKINDQQTQNSKHFDDINELFNNSKYLIISGQALFKISSSSLLIEMLSTLSLHCKAVICCRVSPKQKAEIVKMVKKALPDSQTMSIGDGANDVNMLTEAHVGIGIKGHEGQQAARISDFAINEFKHVKRLMMLYGRECYRKNSLLVLFTFWKNIMLVFPQFWMSVLYGNFSGIPVYEKFMVQMFNMLFAALPIIIFAVFDAELTEKEFLKKPELYKPGISKIYFNLSVFCFWLLKALIHSFFLSFFSSILGLSMNSSGHYFSFSTIGMVIYILLCLFVNFNIYIISNSISCLSQGFLIKSIASVLICCVIVSTYKSKIEFGVFMIIFSDKHFYMVFIALFVIIFIIDYLFEIFQRIMLLNWIGLTKLNKIKVKTGNGLKNISNSNLQKQRKIKLSKKKINEYSREFTNKRKKDSKKVVIDFLDKSELQEFKTN